MSAKVKAWWREQKWRGTVVEVHDGDTLTVEIDRGFDDFSRKRVRLRGCNARELFMSGGEEAGQYLRHLTLGGSVLVANADWDKYGGRILGDVVLVDYDGVDLAARLIRDGFAAKWDGKGPKRIPVWPIPADPPPTAVLIDRDSPDWRPDGRTS